MQLNARRKAIYFEEEARIKCSVCGGKFAHLGSHLWHKHQIKAQEYKEQMGLPHNFSLISRKVHDKIVDKFNQDREKYLANLMKDNGHRFYKGMRMPKGQYRSERAIKRVLENLDKINRNKALESCPICHIKFERLASHLYNKHNIILVDKENHNQ